MGLIIAASVVVCILAVLGPKLAPAFRRGAARRRARAESLRASEAWREKRRIRIAELSADPAIKKYADMMAKGGYWTDEQIEYQEDPNVLATCVHLQPVEQAMRRAGIKVQLMEGQRIQADCRLEIDKVTLAPSVEYRQGFMPERHPEDNPWFNLHCNACQSTIDLIPMRAGTATPTFP